MNDVVVPGKTVACASCHGPGLMGMGDAPAIAGRSPSYLARQLYDFQQGTRHGLMSPLMKPTVEKLTNADIVAIVAYVASLKPTPIGMPVLATTTRAKRSGKAATSLRPMRPPQSWQNRVASRRS